MAKVEHYLTRFEEYKYYHVYNRAVDKGSLFKNHGNYEFFIRQYLQYLSPVANTYAYCLMGNHFHFLMQVRELQDFKQVSKIPSDLSVHDIVAHQFRKFFQSYSMAYNKQQQRIGGLFQTPFKRTVVDNGAYFTQLVYYIHANPQKHGVMSDFRDWPWTSYHSIISEEQTWIDKTEVLQWFGGKEDFLNYHQQIQQQLNERLAIE